MQPASRGLRLFSVGIIKKLYFKGWNYFEVRIKMIFIFISVLGLKTKFNYFRFGI